MFRRLAIQIPEGALGLFKCHPAELTTVLEVAWRHRVHDPAKELGEPARRSDLSALPDFWLDALRASAGIEPPPGNGDPNTPPNIGTSFERALNPSADVRDRRTVFWDHLIYAYMIENTNVYEIFHRVLYEFLHGEKLGAPIDEAEHWLRTTEQLFYRSPYPFSITSIASDVRPDMRATRRNAYCRMFGMDLNHGTDAKQAYPYVKPETVNSQFVGTFNEFLHEVWVGITNEKNTSGANPTDDSKIADLAEKLRDMLTARRESGTLAREEFAAVSMMSWFHLTLDFDSPIVKSLDAKTQGIEQRLFKIAAKVGVPAHALSKHFFDIADPLSRVLILIETGRYHVEPAVRAFYLPGPLQSAMRSIIHHWSAITGRDVKAGKITAS